VAAEAASPPGSIRIPGTDATVAFGGFAKVDFIQDFDAIGDPDEFKVNTIPVEGTPAADQGGRASLSARATRFNVEFRSPAPPAGELRAFVEGDFFGDKSVFRMRHAYGQLGRLLGGQTWSTFMDISARPVTIDLEGADAEILVRQAMIRYTQPLSKHLTWAIAVENPDPQFTVPAGMMGSPRSDAADLPTYFRYERDRGHFQVAGILRRIRFDGEQGDPDLAEIGWGLNGTFRIKTLGKFEFMGQIAHGQGIGRYIESFGGQSADAVITPAGDLETMRATAVVLGSVRHWRENLRSGITLSVADLETDSSQPGTSISRTEDARANLIWTPYRLVDCGGELLWGRREDRDDSRGDAWRFQFSITWHFV